VADPKDLLDTTFAASNMAYTLENGGKPDPGWRQVTHDPNSKVGKDLAAAQGYELIAPNGLHVIAFAGTAHAGDIAPDVGNAVGVKTEKYLAAAEVGEDFKGKGYVMTGHSLGGGLAKTAAAVASHGKAGEPEPAQCVAVGFNPAPIGTRVLAQHGIDANKPLESETITVVNRNDILNRVVEGGKLHIGDGGDAIHARENANEVTVVADGAGSVFGVAGHKIAGLADPANPGHLTTKLGVDGTPVEKASFDRYINAQIAAESHVETKTALHMAAAPSLMDSVAQAFQNAR
jgi:lipase (class 3)